MARPKKGAREIEQTRRHILEAAARVFARRGLAASSMQDIAAEAGYSAPTLYSYFKGKQAIVDSLVAQLQHDSAHFFNTPFPSGMDLRQRLELLLMKQAAWVDLNREAFVFFSRREGMDAAGDANSSITPPPYVAQFAHWLARVTTREELHGRTPEAAAYLVWGLQHAMFIRWLAEGTPDELVSRVPDLVSFFLHGLTGPPRAEDGR